MTTVLLLGLGLAGGVALEQVSFRRRDHPADQAAGPLAGSPVRPRRRPGLKLGALLATLLLVALPVAGYLWASYEFSRIGRVAGVASHLSHGGRGTNYLLVGADGRPGVAGNRSDTIMLLHLGAGGARTMSIPRDLWVTLAGRSTKAKINAAHNDSAAELVDTVEQNLGLRINRYLEVNYTSFGPIVDALGGVTINFPHPASDVKSGLNVAQQGDVHLDGAQALAYVRSRTYTETIDGRSVTDPTADLGRVKRQQAFLRAVMAKAGRSKNPFRLMSVASAMTRGVRIDGAMSLWDAIRFGWDMGGLNPQPVTLPTTPDRAAGQDILRLDQAPAGTALAQFR